MQKWTDTYNLKGFIVGNGVTDMYIDSDNQMIESLANWNMIPTSLWNQIVANNCFFKWVKLDVPVHNPPQCANLFDQVTSLIKDLDIYDLWRTQYNNGSSSGVGVKMTP